MSWAIVRTNKKISYNLVVRLALTLRLGWPLGPCRSYYSLVLDSYL
jgi:hypothetical protein